MRKSDIPAYSPEVCSPSVIIAGEFLSAFSSERVNPPFFLQVLTKLLISIDLVINGHYSALRSPKLSRILTWLPRKQTFQSIVTKFARTKFFPEQQ